MTKIIAEVCQNHKGDRNLLGQMIKEAAQNGADYVKMQTIFSSDLTKRERFENGEIDAEGKTKIIKRPYEGEFERLSKLDLSIEDHIWFIEECKKNGVIPMTTIFSRNRIKEIGQLPWPEKVVKVASYDCASYPMIRELMNYFDHLIISTGATYDQEIEKTAKLVKESGKKFALLHCVTSYPNTLDMCNLNRMEWLKKLAPEAGWSDHTLIERDGVLASKAAMYLGADYAERHFTVLEKDQTKDGPVSITPALLKELSDFNKLDKKSQLKNIESQKPDWQIMLGSKTREMTPTELVNRDYYRGRFASLVNGEWVYNWEEKEII
jgi:N,N'-diacetyllegionaminate synthase